MKKLLIVCTLVGLFQASAQASDGLISVKSSKNVPATVEKLVAALEEKGMRIFARIDHAAAAEKAGLSLPPTELVIFGNPKIGTLLMQCERGFAIDLPLKAVVWEDGDGQTWLSYNAPAFLAKRHQLQGCQEVIGKVDKALAGFAKAATE